MNDSNSLIIAPQSAEAFVLYNGQKMKIIDMEGMQVADLTAVNAHNHSEILSMGVTIDQNNSLRIQKGDYLFSNLYNDMFWILEDSVGKHDLLHPMCSSYMFLKQYEKIDHPSCEQNIKHALSKCGVSLDHAPIPLNAFMNTNFNEDGSIEVLEPASKPGNYLLMEACMDLIIGLSACSVEDSKCNGFKCTSIKVELLG